MLIRYTIHGQLLFTALTHVCRSQPVELTCGNSIVARMTGPKPVRQRDRIS